MRLIPVKNVVYFQMSLHEKITEIPGGFLAQFVGSKNMPEVSRVKNTTTTMHCEEISNFRLSNFLHVDSNPPGVFLQRVSNHQTDKEAWDYGYS